MRLRLPMQSYALMALRQFYLSIHDFTFFSVLHATLLIILNGTRVAVDHIGAIVFVLYNRWAFNFYKLTLKCAISLEKK